MGLKKKLKTVRVTRKGMGVTQPDIYRATQIWMSKISMIESGHVVATEEEKKKIAKFLKVKVDNIDWEAK